MSWTLSVGVGGVQRLFWNEPAPNITLTLVRDGVAIEVDADRGRVVGLTIARRGTPLHEILWLLERVPRWMLGPDADLYGGVIPIPDTLERTPERFRGDPAELDAAADALRARVPSDGEWVSERPPENADERRSVAWSDLPPSWRPQSTGFWNAIEALDAPHIEYRSVSDITEPPRVLLVRGLSDAGEITQIGRLHPDDAHRVWTGRTRPFGDSPAETTHWQVVDRMGRPTRTLDEQRRLIQLQHRLLVWAGDAHPPDDPDDVVRPDE